MVLVATVLVVVGGTLALGGLVNVLMVSAPDGFGHADGRVVEVDRPGKRPTVVEFVPAGAAAPVRFRSRDPYELGEPVTVRYSEAAPENARVAPAPPTAGDRRRQIAVSLLASVVGAVVLWFTFTSVL